MNQNGQFQLVSINGGKMNKEKTGRVLDYFDELFPDAYCELNHETDFQLLVAVMLKRSIN